MLIILIMLIIIIIMLIMTGTASTGIQQLMQVLASKHLTSLPGMIITIFMIIIITTVAI